MFTILPQSAFSSPRDRQVAVDNVNKLDLTTLLNIMLGFTKNLGFSTMTCSFPHYTYNVEQKFWKL